MYGEPSEAPALAWSWVDAELANAGTYWVVAHGGGHPHPRPVWGVWQSDELHLSIGSPVIGQLLGVDRRVTVHLDSGLDVVIVEGADGGSTEAGDLYEAYNSKYDWNYTTEEYGPLTTIVPTSVLGWRATGFAGREGFLQTGRWRFAAPTTAPAVPVEGAASHLELSPGPGVQGPID